MRRFLRRLLRLLALLVLLAVLAAAGVAAWLWRRLERPYPGHAGEVTVVVEPGQPVSSILRELETAGVIEDARLARIWLVRVAGDPPLRAGEYVFGRPLPLAEALGKLIRGEVATHAVTVVEGLDLDETAESLARQGFGRLGELYHEVRRAERIHHLDPAAADLEGYLFPDTYHFPRGVSEKEVVDALVRGFERRLEREVAPVFPGGVLPEATALRELVILASIVEKESRLDDERPLVASVYRNRLDRNMGLYADPTLIYGLKRAGVWDGDLRRRDLLADSPWNTYRHRGLPPGPICSPGVASLRAAAAPPATEYLYFVSRNDGSHVFSESYAEHQRQVERWQRRFFRERRAGGGGEAPRDWD